MASRWKRLFRLIVGAWVLGLLLVACGRRENPEGTANANWDVDVAVLDDSHGPQDRGTLRLRVTSLRTGVAHAIDTGASAFSKWALGWLEPDTLVLYSSDIGTRAYKLSDPRVIERTPGTDEDAPERAVAADAYEAKYGERPSWAK